MSNGALFKNDKGGVDKRPDYRGDIIIDEKKYKLSAWIKKDVKDRAYLSLRASPFTQEITEEDIPF